VVAMWGTKLERRWQLIAPHGYSPTLKSAALGLHGTRTRMPASFLQVLADFAHAGQDRPGPFDLDHCENDAALSARGGAQRSEIWRKTS
jgi:hypothetical protein